MTFLVEPHGTMLAGRPDCVFQFAKGKITNWGNVIGNNSEQYFPDFPEETNREVLKAILRLPVIMRPRGVEYYNITKKKEEWFLMDLLRSEDYPAHMRLPKSEISKRMFHKFLFNH